MYHDQDSYVMNSFPHEQGCFSLRMRAPLGLPLSLHILWNFVRHMESCASGSVIHDDKNGRLAQHIKSETCFRGVLAEMWVR